MPTLVNYNGDDELYHGGSFCPNPIDLGRLCKRARISAPDIFEIIRPDQDQKHAIEVLPDECLFEIFRRVSSGKGRSSCACVSKRWLMLMSSICKAEVCKSDKVTEGSDSCDVEMASVDEDQVIGDDGFLTRCLEGKKATDVRLAAIAVGTSTRGGLGKRWLMLMSSICKAEVCKSDKVTEGSDSCDVEMASVDEDQVIGDDGFLTRCLEGKKATDVRLAAIAVGTSTRGGLGKLSIRGSNSVPGVTDNGLAAVARGCPSLRSFSLWDVSSIGDKGLSEIAKGCHMLEKLDICQASSISNKSLIAIAKGCPNLITLNIESCPKIGNEGLQAIARSCPKLQCISIKDCPLVGDHGVSSLLSSANNLSRVKLQDLNITDFSLAVIGHYGKAIVNLLLCGLQNVSERGFWVMGVAQGLQKLVSLTVSSCRGVTDASIEAMGKGCINLKQMSLRRCCFVSDNGLVAFSKAAKTLESLQLEECNSISQFGIICALSSFKTTLKSLTLLKCKGVKDIDVDVSMLSPCESLRHLSIHNCPGIGNSSLAMVGKLCPQLQHVDLTGLYGVTDAGLLPLLENCEAGLVKVNLAGCWNLTDNIVSELARLHGGTLELLNLDGCRKITDASLVAIADNCLLLNDLDMSKCAITDAGIVVLSSARQLTLQVLSLSNCSGVTNNSAPSLTKLGQTLVGLDLQNCNSIGCNTVMLLVENLGRCDILA